ncbi:MAG: ATP-dependent DNA helicase RecQ [Cytophagales bacterium]|nr:ATP-dependent DNA helicase RecQ [Cytophagales bacterium]
MSLVPLDILKKYWGYEAFRPLQEDIIQSVLDDQPTLALLPTGGGKSICFQVPAIALEGLCLVISPLIALMRDQVDQLEDRGIKAKALYSGMSKKELDITLDNCIYGEVKFLYVSPERLQSDLFLTRARQMNFSMIAIDEAHCISQWGYDFRPPYLLIKDFIDEFSIGKVLALTATATKEVKLDITERLGMKEAQVFKKSFARKNLSYSVFHVESKLRKMLEILHNVPGSSVVYVRSRKRTGEIARILSDNRIAADHYHAGLSPDDRADKQEKWIKGSVRVMVATNAFGMGIDKPDVRSVIHLDIPDTLEAYYQEAGRAGRDEKKAYAVMLIHESDKEVLLERIEKSQVSLELLKRTYQALSNFYKLAIGSLPESSLDFDMEEFANTYNLTPLDTYNALSRLEKEGLIQMNEGFNHASRIMIRLQKEDLYRFQVSHPQLDLLIKGILRLYGGELFSQYGKVSEKELAKMLNSNPREIKGRLKMLHQYEVIDYQSAASRSQLTFLVPRLDVNALPIDGKALEDRKKLILGKAHKVLDFINDQKTCRTRMLQAYFDEITDEHCGVCDYCVNRKKRNQILLDPNELYQLVKTGGSIKLQEVMTQKKVAMEDVLDAVRPLIEEDRVKLDGDVINIKPT